MQKMPVTVIAGFLGSGKTTLLNQLLRRVAAAPAGEQVQDRILVLVNEVGAVGLDHHRVQQVQDDVVLLDSACICCAVRGELVQALQKAFLDALHKKIPPFSRVLIETKGIADPAPIMYTLRYDRFLAERYQYAGCITVVDGVFGAAQLQSDREAVQQAVLADVLVISKTDLATSAQSIMLKQALGKLNPMAEVLQSTQLSALDDLLQTAATGAHRPAGRQGSSLWSGGVAAPQLPHYGVSVLTMSWHTPLLRSRFAAALAELQSCAYTQLLRIKGQVWFQGAEQAVLVHGVHQHWYPAEPLGTQDGGLSGRPAGVLEPDSGKQVPKPHSFVVVITRGGAPGTSCEVLDRFLPGGSPVVSPAGNFVD